MQKVGTVYNHFICKHVSRSKYNIATGLHEYIYIYIVLQGNNKHVKPQ
jgi:hypothetical protein